VLDVTSEDVLRQLQAFIGEFKEALAKDRERLKDKELDISILSLNNPWEQLNEWVEGPQFTDVYSLLVCFGFPAYPVRFAHNNAVQMDPF